MLVALPALAENPGDAFDPNAACYDALVDASEMKRGMVAAWTFGYLGALKSDVRPVTAQNNAIILQNLAQACADNPQASLVEILNGPKPQATSAEGGEAAARALLEAFLDPAADRAALTAKLAPSPEDVAAVYSEPLASRLSEAYAQMFTPGVAIGPKAGQDTVLMVYTTTDALRAGNAALAAFPGGYKDVLQYMNPGFPIVRFKFVREGETTGMAFDGLVFVNGRWVLMPKPWRMLP